MEKARRVVIALVVLLVGMVESRLVGDERGATTVAAVDRPAYGLGPSERSRADALIGVFEHSTVDQRYDAAEELHDGRGLTAGRAGFTSATGDLLLVVRRYVQLRRDTPLRPYLTTLEHLAADQSDDTTDLAGFAEVWRAAAGDPSFRAVQDGVVDQLYYRPAMRRAERVGATRPLTLAILYDTAVQHGDGDDPDGLAALIAETTKTAGGSPASGVDEDRWTGTFLGVRRRHLAHAADPATRTVWAESVDRVDALRHLLDDGIHLDRPFLLHAQGGTFAIP